MIMVELGSEALLVLRWGVGGVVITTLSVSACVARDAYIHGIHRPKSVCNKATVPTLSTHNPGSDFGCLPTFEELTNRLTIVRVNLWHHATAVPDNQTLYNRNHALCSSLAITVDRLTIYQGTNKGLGLGLPSESYLCNVNISSAFEDNNTTQHYRSGTQDK